VLRPLREVVVDLGRVQKGSIRTLLPASSGALGDGDMKHDIPRSNVVRHHRLTHTILWAKIKSDHSIFAIRGHNL